MPKEPKVHPIKSAKEIPAPKGKIHQVIMINRGTYWDAVCHTCNHQSLVGGDGAEGMLIKWALWHSPNTEIHVHGEELDNGKDTQ